MEYGEFLKYAAGAGVSTVVAVVLSLMLSYGGRVAEWFEALGKAQKQLVYIGLCFVVPMGATVLGVVSDGWDAAWPGVWWAALASGFAASGIGQITHRGIVKLGV